MAYPPEIAGYDVEWFALDSAGEAAIFTTAGEGGVPAVVAAHLEAHHGFSAQLGPGSRDHAELARLGFHAYDWVGPYVRQQRSAGPMDPALHEALLAHPGVPRMGFRFADVLLIEVGDPPPP